jgi:hypothetical protein
MNMQPAREILDRMFFEMRWRTLSLASDLDRIERAEGSGETMDDPRIAKLKKAIAVLSSGTKNRAEQVQMIFSDMSPPPGR